VWITQHYRFHGPLSSCDPQNTGSCVAFAQGPVVANFIDEFGQEHEPYLWQKPVLSNLSGIDQGTNFLCMNLRSRAPDGTLSSPISLCTDDGPLLELSGSSQIRCSAAGLTQGDPLPPETNSESESESESGCALAPQTSRGFGWIGLALALTTVLARRRRLRKRTGEVLRKS
jgi:hypothetical protein